MRGLHWLAVLALVLLMAAACGGDGGGGDDGDEEPSSQTITIIPNLGQRREGLTEEETLELFKAIMERRAEYIEGSAVVTVNEDKTLTVEYSGIDDDIAVDLYTFSANLAVGGPRRNGDNIVCLIESGQERRVPVESIVYDQLEGRFLPHCELDDGTSANIAWQDFDVPGLGRLVNLDIDSVALETETGPTLVITFNEDGTAKLAAITSQLVELPMGIFIDGLLLAGPRVSEPIPNGQIAIAGLTLREARIFRAQLRAGAIPSPYVVRVNE